MQPWTIVGIVVVLVGCASSPKKLDRELRPYVGQNIAAVSAVLGSPDSEHESLGETLYTWTVNNHFTIVVPPYDTASGFIGGLPFFATSQGAQDVRVHDECNLQIATDSAGVIKDFRSNGNGGCQRFVKALDM
jgi:hypothetical protein